MLPFPCPVSWPQKLTVRPKPEAVGAFVGLYWVVGGQRWIRFTEGLGGAFGFRRGIRGLFFTGSMSPVGSNVLGITLDRASWRGAPLCVPGSHLFPADWTGPNGVIQ